MAGSCRFRCRRIFLRSSIALIFFFASFPLFSLALSDAALAQTEEELLRIGKDEFNQCTFCHGFQGEGNLELAAPTIAGMDEWYLVSQLVNWQKCARGFHPEDLNGLRMRPMARTLRSYDGKTPTITDRCLTVNTDAAAEDPSSPDVKLRAVAKYTASLKTPELPRTVVGSPVRGEKLYQICSTCHGVDGRGNKDLHAPSLVKLNDWYIVNQLKSFKEGHRGTLPELDPWGATMRPNAMTLSEQDMADLADYISRLR